MPNSQPRLNPPTDHGNVHKREGGHGCHASLGVPVYCTLAALFLTGSLATAQPPSELASRVATFNIFVRSTLIGFEQVEVTRNPNGWIIRSRGSLARPIDLQNQFFEIKYDEKWHPQTLTLNGVRTNTPFSIRTTFDENEATNELEEAGQQRSNTTPLPPAAIVMPDYYFAAYEALASRLAGTEPGDELSIYVVPRGGNQARVDQVSSRQIDVGSTVIDAQVYLLSFLNPGAPLVIEVWTDLVHRLLRVSIPALSLDVAREDLVSSNARVRRVSHPGDKDTMIRANGFSLAATITTPVDKSQPADGWPTVLLVPSPGTGDRDGALSGLPVLGQMAGALSDRGFLVTRYDPRGTGQSGGRLESADIDAYADDARTVVRYLEELDNIDRDRVTVLGSNEGGWIAMAVAGKERRIDNLVLVGTPSMTGVDLVMEQQRDLLDRLGVSEAERLEKIALQQRIHDAVLDNGSWDGVPEAMRKTADTPWFRDFLEFDTADAMQRIRQPILILHGSLDNQVDPQHAVHLAELAGYRRRDVSVDQVTLEGLDHLLVDTSLGVVANYNDMRSRSVSSEFIDTLVNWLEQLP